MTKFGIDQIESPPPKWWRKLERAFIIGVAPAITAMILAVIPDDDKAQPIALAVVTLITSIVKSIGIFLGNGEQYADAEESNI